MATGFSLERDGWLLQHYDQQRVATTTDTKLCIICYPVMKLVTSPPTQALGTLKKQSDDADDDYVSPLQLKKTEKRNECMVYINCIIPRKINNGGVTMMMTMIQKANQISCLQKSKEKQEWQRINS